MQKSTNQWKAFDLAEAFHVSHAIATLNDLKVFAALEEPATAEKIASKYKLDAKLLRGVLEYLAARTDLVRKSSEGFVTTRRYRNGSHFLIELYLGAYGGNSTKLGRVLRNPSSAPEVVDRRRYARAFDPVDRSSIGFLAQLIRKLEINRVLDLGCGSAELLFDLAKHDPSFIGWGIDINREMCRTARTMIRTAGLGKQVKLLQGDCMNPGSLLRPSASNVIEAITACNFANELFRDGHALAVEWLRGLHKAFRGRLLMIDDYYGRLGGKGGRKVARETLLHDYVQLISGQGIPPASAAEWRSIYSKAKCRLVHIIEDKTTTRFIHILKL
jgi:SAM-dependent methyltransferase